MKSKKLNFSKMLSKKSKPKNVDVSKDVGDKPPKKKVSLNFNLSKLKSKKKIPKNKKEPINGKKRKRNKFALKLSLGKKFGFGLLSMVIVLVIMTVMIASGMSAVSTQLDLLENKSLVVLQHAQTIKEGTLGSLYHLTVFTNTHDEDAFTIGKAEYETTKLSYDEVLAIAEETEGMEEMREKLAIGKTHISTFDTNISALETTITKDLELRNELLTGFRDIFNMLYATKSDEQNNLRIAIEEGTIDKEAADIKQGFIEDLDSYISKFNNIQVAFYDSMATRDISRLNAYKIDLRKQIPIFSELKPLSLYPDNIDYLAKIMNEFTSSIAKYTDNMTYIDLTRTDLEHNAEFLSQVSDSITTMANEHTVNSTSASNKALDQNILFTIIAICIAVVLGVLVNIIIIRGINKSLKKTTNVLHLLADGDLTQYLNIKTHDEIGDLSNTINHFSEKIKLLIGNIQNSAQSLSISTEELSKTTEDSNRGMEQIAQDIQHISGSVQSNVSVVEESNAQIQEMASNTDVIKSETTDAFNTSKKILSAVKTGASSIEEIVDANKNVKLSTDDVSLILQDLKVSSDKIGNIVKMIKDIAQQSNMLALNASIEAARAGDAGKGFAVVADEVRKLAIESGDSAEQIKKIILEIQTKADDANTAIHSSQQLVDLSVNKSYDARNEFDSILKGTDEISDKVESITRSAAHQNIIATEMTKAIEEIANTSSENANSVDTINQVIEGQVAAFEEISASLEELNEMANELKRQTEIFKI